MTQAEYQQLIASRGLKTQLAIPLAARTSREWEAGHHTWLDSFHGNEKEAEYVAQMVKRRTGKFPKRTDRWVQSLAQVTGDPNAVIPAGDGPSIIKQRVEKLNLTWDDGFVKHQRRQQPLTPNKPLSERFIREHLREIAKTEPDKINTPAKRKKVREAIIEKHGYKESANV